MNELTSHEREQVMEQIGALKRLMESPGWAMLKAHFAAVAEKAERDAIGSDTPHRMAKELGMLAVARDVVGWPEVAIRMCETHLQQYGPARP